MTNHVDTVKPDAEKIVCRMLFTACLPFKAYSAKKDSKQGRIYSTDSDRSALVIQKHSEYYTHNERRCQANNEINLHLQKINNKKK